MDALPFSLCETQEKCEASHARQPDSFAGASKSEVPEVFQRIFGHVGTLRIRREVTYCDPE